MQKDDDFLYANMPQTEKAMLSYIPPEDELHHKFSRRFNRKMAALLKYERRTPTMRVVVRQMKTAAAVFVIVLSMAFGTVMSVEAYISTQKAWQQYKSGRWITLETFTTESDSHRTSLTETYSVSKGYSYRVQATIKAYSGYAHGNEYYGFCC